MSEGNKSRTVAATQMNAESSRSHAVFSIVLTQTMFDPASQVSADIFIIGNIYCTVFPQCFYILAYHA